MNGIAPAPRTRWSPIAWSSYLKGLRQVYNLQGIAHVLERIAERSWIIDPGITTIAPPAFHLPGQLDRVTGTASAADDPRRNMPGGFEVTHAPTRGFLLKDTWLIDGSLYKRLGGRVVRMQLHPRTWLSRKTKYLPRIRTNEEFSRAAIYNNYLGTEYFGLWLTENCPLYPLAEQAGTPVAATLSVAPAMAHYPHTSQYEQLLGMKPQRTSAAYLREVVLFDDNWENNAGKRARLEQLRSRLLSHTVVRPHPGTFILRRGGKTRVLDNELELAELLQQRRGFRIVDIKGASVLDLVTACAGARVIIGVEGSQLHHGLMVLQPGGALVSLQPPSRFCSTTKRTMDMLGQHYGFVVGQPTPAGYHIDPVEMERTLDLLPACPY